MRSLLLAILLVSTTFVYSQIEHQPTVEEQGLVKWLSFNEALELNKKQPKPFLIDIYTDWCGWCKQMMRTTYSDPNLSAYINTWFYPVKFNAEGHDTIDYLGTKYVNPGKEPRSTHQLAIKFLGNKLSYPSTLFIGNNFQFQLNTSGYLDNRQIEPILVYTVENIFRTTAYEEFKTHFQKAFYDTTKPKDTGIKFYSLTEAEKLNKKAPKKFIFDIYTNWCNGCQVMNKTTFNDPKVKEYLTKHFYLVDLNAETKDSMVFQGKTYRNNGANGTPFHDLVMELSHRNLSLPTLIIMDESMKTIDTLPFYISPETLEPVLQFYGDNAYKTENWKDYVKKFSEKQMEKENAKQNKKEQDKKK
jgi:thioredoxin-related protein